MITTVETLKHLADVLFGVDNPSLNGEEYLELLESASCYEEKEFFTEIYNFLLAKRQKEVIKNERY